MGEEQAKNAGAKPEITEAQIQHIAHLARLKLTGEEVSRYADDLNRILDHFQQLQAIDVTNVAPSPYAVELANVLREDEPRESPGVGMAMANAPDKHKTFFKAPKVLDQDV